MDAVPGVSVCRIPQDWLRIINIVKGIFIYDFSGPSAVPRQGAHSCFTAAVTQMVETIANCTHSYL